MGRQDINSHPCARTQCIVNFDSSSDDMIDGAQLLPYPVFPASPSLSPSRRTPDLGGPPASIALTELHFISLYKDRVVALSSLNEQMTYEEALPLVSIIS